MYAPRRTFLAATPSVTEHSASPSPFQASGVYRSPLRAYFPAKSSAPLLERILRASKGMLLSWFWRSRGVSLADRIIVRGPFPRLTALGPIAIGSRLSFRSDDVPARIGCSPIGRLEIGDQCFINGGATIYASKSITIGPHCLIGENVTIIDRSFHELEEGDKSDFRSISIGRNVWLAKNAMILPGVELGDHCVVGAGSVVTKSFPARSLVAGNPARLIRTLKASDDWVRR